MCIRDRYYFAKTMPDNPHWYTLRREWASDEEFVYAAAKCQEYGVTTRWWNRAYRQLALNGYYYWTVGEWPQRRPPEEESLINRKRQPYTTPWDEIASRYDKTREIGDIEKGLLREILGEVLTEGASVLDIGCGTGLFVDMYPGWSPPNYFGIDKSVEMLRRFAAKHPDHVERMMTCSFEDFYPPKRYDVVVALFGSGQSFSEVDVRKVIRLTAPEGRWYVMNYAGGRPRDESAISVPEGKGMDLLKQVVDREPVRIGYCHQLYSGGGV